jgi:hypothetical protein
MVISIRIWDMNNFAINTKYLNTEHKKICLSLTQLNSDNSLVSTSEDINLSK